MYWIQRKTGPDITRNYMRLLKIICHCWSCLAVTPYDTLNYLKPFYTFSWEFNLQVYFCECNIKIWSHNNWKNKIWRFLTNSEHRPINLKKRSIYARKTKPFGETIVISTLTCTQLNHKSIHNAEVTSYCKQELKSWLRILKGALPSVHPK